MTERTGLWLLTIPQTAERLSCSENHVYRLIAAGSLRAVELRATGTRPKTRIREDDLESFVEARTEDTRRRAWGGVVAG